MKFEIFERILRIGLLFDGLLNNVKSLLCCFNVDYKQDPYQSKSITEYVFNLDDEYISWISILHHWIVQCITEVKYVTAAKTASEVIWLDSIITKMWSKQDNLYYDR